MEVIVAPDEIKERRCLVMPQHVEPVSKIIENQAQPVHRGVPSPTAELEPDLPPYLLGAAAGLLSQAGTGTGDLAAASRLTLDHIDEIIAAGSETKPRLRLTVDPRPRRVPTIGPPR
ncbi:MAG: hypothetical protein ACRDRN_02210 [Sciscionella sp.]